MEKIKPGFTLSQDDRDEVLYILGDDKEAMLKPLEDIISLWKETNESPRQSRAEEYEEIELVRGKARELIAAIETLDTRASRHVFTAYGVKLQELVRELKVMDYVGRFFWYEQKRGPKTDPHGFDMLVGDLKTLLEDNGFSVTVSRDNVWYKLLDSVLTIINKSRQDPLNQIRDYIERWEEPREDPEFARQLKKAVFEGMARIKERSKTAESIRKGTS